MAMNIHTDVFFRKIDMGVCAGSLAASGDRRGVSSSMEVEASRPGSVLPALSVEMVRGLRPMAEIALTTTSRIAKKVNNLMGSISAEPVPSTVVKSLLAMVDSSKGERPSRAEGRPMARPGWEGKDLEEAVIAARYDETVPAPTRTKYPAKKAKEGGKLCEREIAIME